MTLGKVGIIVAARMSSSRLPGKALKPLQGVPMISFLLRRLRNVKLGEVVVATTDLPADDVLVDVVATEGIPVFRGPEDDVVARFVGAAKKFGFDTVARVTGDCPFVDAELVDWCIAEASRFGHFDLATTKGRFPVGLDVEIYRAQQMALLHSGVSLSSAEREHLTLHFYDRSDDYIVRVIGLPVGWVPGGECFTIDTASDYERAAEIVAKIGRVDFSIPTMLKAIH